MKRISFIALIILLALALCAVVSCGGKGSGGGNDTSDISGQTGGTDAATEPETTAPETEPPIEDQLSFSDAKTVKIDASKRHQTIESFGASGAWWAQYVGTNKQTRDKVAELLFDPKTGIGLNCYRYNIGGGSQGANSNSPSIGDKWRRTYSFEKKPGEYNWNRDAGAVWMMKKAAELGADEIVMFVNSPLERLTKNGRTYADQELATGNIDPKNYKEFAKYVLDVAEHFKVEEGLPIKFISPINEPQYGWNYPPENVWGQEGCHYNNKEILDVLKVFVEEIGKREGLEGVEISAPEGGSWNDDTLAFNLAIMRDKTLGSYFTAIDNHSYWTETATKVKFKAAMDKVAPDVKYRESEWCEMTNGRDLSMDSAFTLADVVYEDMTILDCVSWQYWIAVSCYDYRDGLIYTDADGNNVQVPKRLWSFGNYSRFIDRGYTRIDCETPVPSVKMSAYEGENEYGEKETVIVVINRGKAEQHFNFSGLDSAYNRISVNVTDDKHDLERTYYGEFKDGTAVSVPAGSVTTVVISAKGAN